MDHSTWVNMLLDRICELGDKGQASVQYIRANETKIGFRRVRPNIGAFWTIFRNIRLNSRYYSYDTPLDDLRIKTLIIHEVCHLRQGMVKALSVYGELEAWQLDFRVYARARGMYPHPAIAELMSLPLELDRGVLKTAASVMQVYAGKGYRIDLLPLFPVSREVRYQVFKI